MARDLPPPVTCRGCPAAVRWAKTRLGRNIPLESEPDEHGEWVLFRDQALGLVAAPFDPQLALHHGRPRWKSHLRRCRPPTAQGQQGPPKPDPTEKLKFPRRPARLSWDRPTGRDQVDDFVRALTPAQRRWAEAELSEIAKRWPGVWRTSHG